MIIEPYNNGEFESFQNFQNEQSDTEQDSRNREINDAISNNQFKNSIEQAQEQAQEQAGIEIEEEHQEQVEIEEEEQFDNTEEDKDFQFIIEPFSQNTQKSQEANEPFTGSMEINLLNYHLILKCFLYGMLFYVLNKKQLYDMTESLSSYLNLEPLILHSIVFVILYYILEQLI